MSEKYVAYMVLLKKTVNEKQMQELKAKFEANPVVDRTEWLTLREMCGCDECKAGQGHSG